MWSVAILYALGVYLGIRAATTYWHVRHQLLVGGLRLQCFAMARLTGCSAFGGHADKTVFGAKR